MFNMEKRYRNKIIIIIILQDLKNLESWADTWGMRLNATSATYSVLATNPTFAAP